MPEVTLALGVQNLDKEFTMLGTRHSPLLFTAIALAACAPQEEQSPQDMEADIAAIEAVRAQEVAAISSGEPNTAYLAAEAVIMPPNEPAVRGLSAAEEWMSDLMAQFTVESLEYGDTEIMVSGDWAIELYTGTIRLAPADGGDSMEDVVKGIHVYQRQADGSWKMVYDIWNSNMPLPEM